MSNHPVNIAVMAIVSIILFTWLGLYGKENPVRSALIDIGVVRPIKNIEGIREGVREGVSGKKFRLPSVRDL